MTLYFIENERNKDRFVRYGEVIVMVRSSAIRHPASAATLSFSYAYTPWLSLLGHEVIPSQIVSRHGRR